MVWYPCVSVEHLCHSSIASSLSLGAFGQLLYHVCGTVCSKIKLVSCVQNVERPSGRSAHLRLSQGLMKPRSEPLATLFLGAVHSRQYLMLRPEYPGDSTSTAHVRRKHKLGFLDFLLRICLSHPSWRDNFVSASPEPR